MKARNERLVNHVILATGVSSVVTQLLTIREFLALFAGNEFIIAVIFFNWLMAGGLGTMMAYRATRLFFAPTPARLAWLSLVLAALPPVHLLFIRLLRDSFFIHGSETGFYPVFFYTLATVVPYSLLIGFALPFSLFVLRRESPAYPGAMVYIMDNIGDVAGGAIFSFVLLFLATPLQSACAAGLLLTAAAAPLLIRGRRRFAPRAALFMAVAVLVGPVFIENKTLSLSGGDLVYYREARNGRIQVEHQDGQYTLFLDGAPMASSHNQQAAEEAAHYPLSQVDGPDRVLVISAMAGIMGEIAAHRPREIDYVEIDPDIAATLLRFGLIEKTEQMRIIHDDARAFLTESTQRYDAIIMCLPEPETYQLNRFYTRSFFSLVKRRLTDQGVFSFSLRGFDNYPAEADRQKLSSVYNTAAACFRHVLLLPGEDIFFLCRNTPLTTAIPERLKQKGIKTIYIADYFQGTITAARRAHLMAQIDATAPANSDVRPRLMQLMFARWFTLFDASPTFFYAGVGLFLLLYWTRISVGGFVLFSTGFANMATEILVLFAFQIFFGYLYFKIGLIVTVFLAGLLPGAWMGKRARYRSRRAVLLLDGGLILLSGLFVGAVLMVGDGLPMIFFLVFGLAFSGVCGFQFPAILRLFGDRNQETAGAFTADLIGAAFGALITSVLLIPHAGLAGTGLTVMGLKIFSLILVRAKHGNHEPA